MPRRLRSDPLYRPYANWKRILEHWLRQPASQRHTPMHWETAPKRRGYAGQPRCACCGEVLVASELDHLKPGVPACTRHREEVSAVIDYVLEETPDA